MKPLLAIPSLHVVFSSLEVISCINESIIVLVDVLFGVLINIIRLKHAFRRSSNEACEMDAISGGSPKQPSCPF
ncbi:hypothetical protein Tco_0321679 [Tanacetum coccineum]